jgi:autotransporter-associated beta strand protein
MRRRWPGWLGSASIIFGAADLGARCAVAQDTAYSRNWSGYYASAPSESSFTDIQSTWVIPTVQASSSGTTYSADWVGFDGATDGTVEQCGTSGDITSGGTATYYAWYEFYPANEIEVSLAVHAGDVMTAEITYEPLESSAGNYAYYFDLDDTTTNKAFSETIDTSSSDNRSSAEWIAEAPTVGGSQANLANFGTVTFSGDVAALNSGSDQPANALSPAPNSVIMEQNGAYAAIPMAFDASNESFSIVTGRNIIWNNLQGSSPSNGTSWDMTNNNWSYYYNASSGVNSTTPYADGVNAIFNDNNNGHYAVTLNSTVNPAAVYVAANGNYSIGGTGTISGTAGFFKSATGTLTLSTANNYTGGTFVTNGRVIIEPTSTTTCALAPGALSISGGTVQLADNVSAGTALGTSNVVISSLSLTGTGTLDIGNNRVIVDYTTGHDPIASIAQWIENGYYDLTGPSIISSDIATADAASGLSYGIGYADGADGVVSGLPSGEIEIMFTLLGDANLDGTVNSEDYTPLSHNMGATVVGGWDKGDFNYDGTVNTEDFTLFAHNIGSSASYAAQAGLLEPANSVELTNVPEPTGAAALIAIAGGALLRRRRKIAGSIPG